MLNVKTAPPDQEQTMIDFSAGRISRQRAMRQMETDYSDLLDMLAQRNLPLPELNDAEATRQAGKMVEFLDEMGV